MLILASQSKVPMYARKALLAFFILLIFSHLTPQSICLAETAVISLNFRDASGVLPLVETLLSPQGRATVDARTNSIVVSDDRVSVQKIRDFLAHIDKPVEQVTIRFRFQHSGASKDRDISASGKVSGDDWSVSVGRERKKEGVHVRAQDREGSVARNSESFVRVLSGDAAYIRVGTEIPYTERWGYLCRRYARHVRKVDFQHMETGMEVRPVVTKERVHIEIIPRVSYREPGEKGVIRLSEASTRVSVAKGQWVTIGGHGQGSNEVIREILARRSAEDQASMSLSLMVEP
ncbi:MAG: secretin N-terminal domain-containing protein [Desulfobacteraceae bacterium]